MNEITKSIIVIVSLLIVSFGLLTLTNKNTEPIITQNLEGKTKLLSEGLFKEADGVIEKDGYKEIYYKEELIGFLVESSAFGYASEIKLLVGFNQDKTVKGIKVLDQQETPGLGTRIMEDEFISQFNNKEINKIKLKKNGGEVDAITGATISSNTVTLAVKNAHEKIK